MNESVRAHFKKARERLKDAEGDLSLARYAATVNRTYYVMFDAASAVPLSIGVECATHHGLKIKFGELMVKTGRIDPRFGRYLSRAYDLRENADYALDDRAEIPQYVAQEELQKARDFLAMAESFLQGAGGESETQ